MPGASSPVTLSPILGTGWAFPPRFGASGVAMISGVEDIEQSLAILLSTLPGERVMQPRYGCDLTPLIFAPLTTTLAAETAERVRDALLEFEPRIVPDRITVTNDESFEGRLLIEISYTVSATNSRHNYVHPFFKVEGTEIQ